MIEGNMSFSYSTTVQLGFLAVQAEAMSCMIGVILSHKNYLLLNIWLLYISEHVLGFCRFGPSLVQSNMARSILALLITSCLPRSP
jgi:hypothetical protein